ncbi:glycosyltransferase family 4 protein [Patescibacteria group bacterium]|nr:glycosyltransferase family 4 protein [Patescibacteria group bacterium]MBU4458381.1 glycosyltransferase family 4 protein [Patescibacteria group bacterium]MCG2695864.1 glycosyltransferase family 4 protein [Candidatus Portnoybacteria bacterium]
MQKYIKLCYVLPDYNSKTDSHFFHLYEFLEKASKKLDIFLIVERSSSNKEDIGSVMPDIKFIYIQKFKFIPFRFIESFIAVLIARIKGYKNFYTHYCYIGGTNAAIISRVFGGKSYYWNCAMNWLFKKKDSSKIGYELCLKWSHYLVTGSAGMKKGYIEHYHLSPERVKVMPNWINLERFKPGNFQPKAGPPRAEKTLLFIHWLSKRKGADMIVPIAKHLSQILNTKYKILVAGNGPYGDDLLKEIEENKLKKIIEVLGAIPNENIIKYYEKTDIFIMPSMEEGFPRVLLEAMAMGVPYIASDIGAVREISSEIAQRFLVRSGDAEMFAHKIENLISDERVYEDFRKEELQKIKEYSIDKVIDIFVKLFK